MPTHSSIDQSSDRRQATVLFADISGFTAMSQFMDPEDVAETMDSCFRVLENIILERGGTIDKFIGDCVMALFGAPAALEQAPRCAVNAAIQIRAAVSEFSRKRQLRAQLAVHIGINTGLVVAGDIGGDKKRDYTVMGRTVNLASRLESAAGHGQIFVGSSTYRATRREFDYRRLKDLSLKGFDRPVPAYELLSSHEEAYRARPGEAKEGLSSPMVGRDAELDQIRARLEKLHQGVGGIVSIVAENGMGKSRLLAEVEQLDVAHRVQFHEGRSLSMGEGLKFHPFIDWLRTWVGITAADDAATSLGALEATARTVCPDAWEDIVPVIGRMMGFELSTEISQRIADIQGEALEKAIHRAMERLFVGMAAQQPLAFIMEDLHWADRSSLALLEALLSLPERARVLFILVCRPNYENTERVLRHLDDHLALHHTFLRLGGLPPAACNVLIENLLGSGDLPHTTREQIEARAEGNPFYIEEMLRALMDQGAIVLEKGALRVTRTLPDLEIPATLEEVILARVDQLDPEPKRVLQVASVVGRRFYRRVLAEMLPGDVALDAALEQLTAKQLIAPTRSRRTATRRVATFAAEIDYTFKHALVQEAVYGSLLKRSRRELHAACAASLETMFADRLRDAYAMLAYHYARADALEKAEEYMFKAGEEAAKAAASSEALLHFQEAYRIYMLLHGKDADDTKRALLEKNIAQALFNSGRLSESIEHFDAALELYGEWVPKSQLSLWAKFAYDMAGLLLKLYLRGDRAGTRDREKDLHVIELMYNRARAENITDPTRFLFDTTAAARYLQRLDPAKCDQASEITATAGAFFAFGGLSFAVGRRFLGRAERLVRPERPADAFTHKAMGTVVEFHAGDWSETYAITDALMDRGLRAGRLWGADVYLGMIAERNLRQGRFAEVEADLETLRSLQTEYGYEFAASNQRLITGLLLLERRRLPEARAAMQAYYDLRHENTLHVLGLSELAKIDVLDARVDAAHETLARAEEIIKRGGPMAPFYLGTYWRCRLLADAARFEEDRSTAHRKAALRTARRANAMVKKIARDRVETMRVSARLLRLLGRKKQALAMWQSALDEATRLQVRPELGRTYLEIAEGLAATWPGERFGDRDANGWLREGYEIFRELGLDFDQQSAERTAERWSLELPRPPALRAGGER